jgi:ketosteroid isomerase-like protein
MSQTSTRRAGSLPALSAVLLAGGCATTSLQPLAAPAPAALDVASLQREVEAAERAFAQTMAARDLAAFASFVAEDAIFIEEPVPLRGRAQVVEGWKVLYARPEAPFSWAPERVEVLASGQLALTNGPVHDPRGALIGTFTSIWRRDPDGAWRIIFDRGDAVCDCADQ